MIRKIIQVIPEHWKASLIARFGAASSPDLEEYRGRRKVVVTLAGFYQNLGDMALTYAQKRFIEDTLPGYDVLLVSSLDTFRCMRALKKVVGPEDIITINGGGNMDDIYSSLENARRFVVKSFPSNPIVSFPQTFAFSNTPNGKRELQRSRRVYGNHPNLTIFARELPSLEMMTRWFPKNETYLSPDTVLSLKLEKSSAPRSGIMITLRNDEEARVSQAERVRVEQLVAQKTDQVSVYDTVDVGVEDCKPGTYENTLQSFWEELSSHRVVVTDRLHSMIFCVITGTPVVVLSNSNHKIRGTYETWLTDCNYVKFIDSFDEDKVSEAIDSLWNMGPEDFSTLDLSSEFDGLRRALQTSFEYAQGSNSQFD